ncbi:ATP-dependent zinc metalloprotease FtsH [Cytospora mali]|uniref:ATP-dependent zinc metalloprotease FtsH n=1 Tax=Cytospora mali TaxID=578113 RepID=A0A194W362_CYTMA|nr:ATP-dependent zinc metalloprotease FtsH [Valsa mali]
MSPLGPSSSPHAALSEDPHVKNTIAGALSQSEVTNSTEGEQPGGPVHVLPANIPLASGQDAMSRMADTLDSINASIQQMIALLRKDTTSAIDESDRELGSVYSYEAEEASEDGGQELHEAEHQPMITEAHENITNIRECNYYQFKHYEKNQPKHVIDIFLAGADFETEIKACRNSNLTAEESAPNVDDVADTQLENPGQKWIHQVRINSRFVLEILYGLGIKDGLNMSRIHTGTGHVFLRPFALLLHYHQAMQTKLQIISEEYDEANMGASKYVESGSETYLTPQSLAELRCYVEFVERHLMPDFNRYRNPEQPVDDTQKIRFDDIWYLFYPGQLIYIQKGERFEETPSGGRSIFQNIRRIDHIMQPQHEASYYHDPLYDDSYRKQWLHSLWCYNIDFNGEMYGRQSKELFLKRWEGEKRIMDLDFIPLCYVKDYETVLKRSIADGKALVNLYAQRRGFHSGWTPVNGPLGESLFDADNEKIRNSVHLESDVLVDYQETFNTYPFWKPSFSVGHIHSSSVSTVVALDDRLYANEKSADVSDTIIICDCAAFIENSEYNREDPYIHALVPELRNEEDHALLVRRFFAYSVRERRFVQLDIRALDKRGQRENRAAFDSLQIEYKHLIDSVVQSHFKRKQAMSKGNIGMETQGFFRMKEKGVIIVLHGEPGVGKTATAEAIAQKWNKPLWQITSGDLGIDAEGVERSFKKILRLANLWNCVLVLDEADVFITERDKRDLARNSLVSVFLRMLEYYSGILFLETNRSGVLDEGVTSRVV